MKLILCIQSKFKLYLSIYINPFLKFELKYHMIPSNYNLKPKWKKKYSETVLRNSNLSTYRNHIKYLIYFFESKKFGFKFTNLNSHR